MTNNKQSGFTIIEAVVVVLIVGILIAAAATLIRPYVSSSRLETTKIREENVASALASFAQTYGRLPCPADPNPGVEPFGSPRNSGADGANFATTKCGAETDSAAHVGILPFKALGLNEDQAKDSYGNFLTYAVEPDMTLYNPTNPTATPTQLACNTSVWTDSSGNNKDPAKAAICCPIRNGNHPALPPTNGDGTTSVKPPESASNVKPPVTHYSLMNINIVRDITYQTGRMKESNSSWVAPSNMVMTGRWHEHDENGDTTYVYSSLKAVDENNQPIPPGGTISIGNIAWEMSHKESQAVYYARGGTIVVGRQHSGDENGQTSYLTGFLNFNGRAATLYNTVTSAQIKESSATMYIAPGNNIINLRIHSGDENGQTQYQSVAAKTKAVVKTITTTNPDGSESSVSTIDPSKDPDAPLPPDETGNVGGPDVTASQAGIPNRVMAFYLISHGVNGDGAYQKQTNVQRQVTTSGNTAESGNSGTDFSKFVASAAYSTADGANYFDDVVLGKYSDELVTMTGSSCAKP